MAQSNKLSVADALKSESYSTAENESLLPNDRLMLRKLGYHHYGFDKKYWEIHNTPHVNPKTLKVKLKREFVNHAHGAQAGLLLKILQHLDYEIKNAALSNMFRFACVDMTNKITKQKSWTVAAITTIRNQMPHLFGESYDAVIHFMTSNSLTRLRNPNSAETPIVAQVMKNALILRKSDYLKSIIADCCLRQKENVVTNVEIVAAEAHMFTVLIQPQRDGALLKCTIVDPNGKVDLSRERMDRTGYYYHHIARVTLALFLAEFSPQKCAIEILDTCGFQPETIEPITYSCGLWALVNLQIIVQHADINTHSGISEFRQRIKQSNVNINHLAIAYLIKIITAAMTRKFGISYNISNGKLHTFKLDDTMQWSSTYTQSQMMITNLEYVTKAIAAKSQRDTLAPIQPECFLYKGPQNLAPFGIGLEKHTANYNQMSTMWFTVHEDVLGDIIASLKGVDKNRLIKRFDHTLNTLLIKIVVSRHRQKLAVLFAETMLTQLAEQPNVQHGKIATSSYMPMLMFLAFLTSTMTKRTAHESLVTYAFALKPNNSLDYNGKIEPHESLWYNSYTPRTLFAGMYTNNFF